MIVKRMSVLEKNVICYYVCKLIPLYGKKVSHLDVLFLIDKSLIIN